MSAKNGKPCKNCGGQDWNKEGKCKYCKSERDRRYREENREAVLERKRQYRVNNSDKVRQGFLDWLLRNPDKKAQSDKRWAQENRDKVKANHKRWRSKPENAAKQAEENRRWRQANPDKAKEQDRRWRRENPEASIAKTHRRRARERNGEGNYTAKEWRDLLARYGNKCLCCGRNDVNLTVDHIVPLSRGGSNDISNIQPLCMSCNDKKFTKIVDYRPF